MQPTLAWVSKTHKIPWSLSTWIEIFEENILTASYRWRSTLYSHDTLQSFSRVTWLHAFSSLKKLVMLPLTHFQGFLKIC